MPTCPTCGARLETAPQSADPIAERVSELQSWCESNGHHVLPDGRVGEATAAALLGLAVGTLENKRRAGNGPRAVRLGVRGSRWSYRLADLAEFVSLHSYDAGER